MAKSFKKYQVKSMKLRAGPCYMELFEITNFLYVKYNLITD